MSIRSVVVRYSADVSSLIRDLDNASKANIKLARSTDEASKATDNVGRKSEDAGKRVNAMAAGGLAVGLALGVAISKFAEFDAQMSAVAAATGATGDELNSLRDAAITAGAATQFSATEAAKGITELSKAGVSATDILNGGLTGALNLAAAGQMDVADAAEIAATAMTQFSLSGAEVSHIADLLAAGAGKAQGSVGDMGMALKQSGLVAAQVGLSIEETTAGLTAFASAGLIGSDAGTSFKSMLQRLTPQSQEAADLMGKLGFSAFDSQGKFKGLEGVAGNLRESLKNLTPEQRNAALATIFGSDAVRAASVLYKQGAEGIHKWTKEVNQQGFAAQQAARLTDNWKGDLERLSGALDTAFIQTGSGANDVLRQTTQFLESIVNTIAKIPGPVLLGAGAFATLALVGPKIGQLAKTVAGPLVSGMARFREESVLAQARIAGYGPAIEGAGDKALKAGEKFKAGAAAGVKAAGGLKGAASGALGILGGPWGIALTAATVAVTAFATAQSNADQAGKEFADTLDQQTGTLTELSRSFVGKKITGDISPEDLKTLQAFGINLGEVTQKILDGGPARQAYIDHLRELAGQADAPNAALAALASTVDNTGHDVDNGRLKWQAYQQALGNTSDSASSADHQMAILGGSTDDFTTSAKNAQGPTDDMGGSLNGLETDAKDATTALKDLGTALDSLGGGQRALRAAQRQFKQDLEDLSKAGKQEKDGTKTQAQLKREYQEALDKAAGSLTNLLDKQSAEHVSVGTLKNTYDDQRAAIEKSLAAHGFHGKALQKEADKILGTRDEFNKLLIEYAKNPETIATQITTPGLDESKKKVEGYWEVINGVPTFIKTKADADTAGAVSDINIVSGLVRSLGAQVAKPKIEPYVDDESGKVVERQLAWLARNRSSTISVQIASAQAANVRATLRDLRSADGNIVKAYGSGGMDVANAHVPEIATSRGTVRIWAEPETGGEAYIPFANDWRRPRAKSIASETVRRLGGSVSWNAGGNITNWVGVMGGSSGIDYRRMAQEFQKIQTPHLTVVSGEDAKTAARITLNEYSYARDNG